MTYNQEELEETICDSFQHCRIYSSINPNILGIHISPYVNSTYKNIQSIIEQQREYILYGIYKANVNVLKNAIKV